MFITTILLTSALVFAGQPTDDGSTSPQVTNLSPRAGKAGTVLVITGICLGKESVEEVYLTDHRFDLKVKVLEQTANTLKVRIPPFVKPGRQQLLLLTGGKTPTYLEQPVWVQVEDSADDKEVVAAQKEAPSKETAGDSNNGNKPDKP